MTTDNTQDNSMPANGGSGSPYAINAFGLIVALVGLAFALVVTWGVFKWALKQ